MQKEKSPLCANPKQVLLEAYNWNSVVKTFLLGLILLATILLASCDGATSNGSAYEMRDTDNLADVPDIAIVEEKTSHGCGGQKYPDPTTSPYILPFAIGETFRTGRTNCSSSYHARGNADQYAFDFDMPVGTPFIAARGGTVLDYLDEEPSGGGGVGNFLIIDHHDGTYGLYYHSPEESFTVAIGDEVKQGDVLGVTGKSGLAGYPHLHFIVVKDNPNYPYVGIPISFSNASPPDTILKDNTLYTALEP